MEQHLHLRIYNGDARRQALSERTDLTAVNCRDDRQRQHLANRSLGAKAGSEIHFF